MGLLAATTRRPCVTQGGNGVRKSVPAVTRWSSPDANSSARAACARRAENVFYLMGACLEVKVRSGGRMACRSCRVERSG
jgi:hypothetical protein